MSELRSGDWIEVRSKEEILATLDKKGRHDEMPFMPQMFQYCGKRFQVYKRAHKTCDTIVYNWDSPGRRLEDGIHLNLRCDGLSHGGCQAACLIYWKELWVKPAGADAPLDMQAVGTGCTEDDVRAATRAEDVEARGQPRFSCQATEVLNFTSPLPWWDARQYVEDYKSGNATIPQILKGFLWTSFYYFTLAFSPRFGAPARYLYDRFQSLWGGLPFPRHRGRFPVGSPTPQAELNLQPGRVGSHQAVRGDPRDHQYE